MPLTHPSILALRPTSTKPMPVRPVGKPWPVNELSAFLSVSPLTIGRLVRSGRLQRLDIGRRVVVTDDSVQRLLAGKPPETAPESAPPRGPE
jgi:hypothetical protein